MQVPKRKSEDKVKPILVDTKITQAKFDELVFDLDKMINKIRPKMIEKVQLYAQNGDFSENADYQIAKGKLRGLNNRILRIEDQIKHAEVIEIPNNKSKVQVGHTVVVEMDGVRKEYQILGSVETDPIKGIISYNSPLVESLMDREKGESFEAELGGKIKQYKIIDIK